MTHSDKTRHFSVNLIRHSLLVDLSLQMLLDIDQGPHGYGQTGHLQDKGIILGEQLLIVVAEGKRMEQPKDDECCAGTNLSRSTPTCSLKDSRLKGWSSHQKDKVPRVERQLLMGRRQKFRTTDSSLVLSALVEGERKSGPWTVADKL